MERTDFIVGGLANLLGNPSDLGWRPVEIGGKTISVPEDWSDNAAQILYKKYMRKDGVPSHRKPNYTAVQDYNARGGVLPSWLWPQEPNYDCTELVFRGEHSADQVFHRIAGHCTYAAWIYGYIHTGQDAEPLYDDCYIGLAKQIFAPNSPQWFNTGIWWAYGCKGSSIAHHPVSDELTMKIGRNAYRWPQTRACFILRVEDNLIDKDGIFETMHKEAQIFKYGSGAGANFSKVREKGAALSSGGLSAGAHAWIGARRSSLFLMMSWSRAITSGFTGLTVEQDDFVAEIAALIRLIKQWQGTADELRNYILYLWGQDERSDSRIPSSPYAVRAKLKRYLPALRAHGIEVILDHREPGTGRRLIKLRVVDQN